MTTSEEQDRVESSDPEHEKPGVAQDDDSGSANTPPPVPDSDDDTDLGDTDQLSDDPA